MTPPPNLRIGHGYDIHRLQKGGRLMMAGVEVSSEISAVAHSDGDVVLHGLVDAILGAMGWGDIGEMFPNTDPRWKNAPSRIFVETVMQKLRAADFSIINVDVTILAEQPRLRAFKPEMVQNLKALTAAPVGIKAGTNEECDSIGLGQAVAAHVVVLLCGNDNQQK